MERSLVVAGGTVTYRFEGGVRTKSSPMAARLALAVADRLAVSAGTPDGHATRRNRRGTMILFDAEYDLLRDLYRGRPSLAQESYATQHVAVIGALAPEIDHVLAKQGLERDPGMSLVVVNAESMQRRWAEEASFGEYPWGEWLSEIAAEQVRAARPDRVLVASPSLKSAGLGERLAAWAGRIEET